MLRVVYQASRDLDPGQVVDIQESRGRVDVRLRPGTRPDQYVPELNTKLQEIVNRCGWFQIWRGQIISAATPGGPLTVQYEPDPSVSHALGVQIRELRGEVRMHVCPDLTAEELAAAVNKPIELFLAGKQWFQFWQGEIVTMDSPESALD